MQSLLSLDENSKIYLFALVLFVGGFALAFTNASIPFPDGSMYEVLTIIGVASLLILLFRQRRRHV
ncbi:hypothetical protein GCM10025751_49610 [Haladaptatus pallidirubidus]|uniref:PEP-CTERM protein-sorting domain-containing protein n=1 Tax=Haladaptatus pallidirubidus TaxID=1008152 RepID=A0AAV3UP80_9EURY